VVPQGEELFDVASGLELLDVGSEELDGLLLGDMGGDTEKDINVA
jgi:hypothetical protein